MPICSGNNEDHCCYVNDGVCKYLLENVVEGRRWACGLRNELGSWDAVHQDPRYVQEVKIHWLKTSLKDYDCGQWPPPGFTCGTCGVVG